MQAHAAKRRKLHPTQALLLEAVKSGNHQMCAQALAEEADVDEKIMFTAIEYGHEDMCKMLITSPDFDINAIIEDAIRVGHERVCKVLLDNHMHADYPLQENPEDLLCMAAECNQPRVCALLVDSYGCDPNTYAPLMIACRCGHKDVCTVLLDRGANISHMDLHTDYTPLIVATIAGHMHIVRLLIERGAYVDQGDGEGDDGLGEDSPLIFASMEGHMDICEFLLDQGADLHRCYQQSPLMWACKYGHENVANLLLDRGADTEQRSSDGFTAFELARRYGHENICNLLRRYSMIRFQCMLLCLHRRLPQLRSAGKFAHTGVPKEVLQLIRTFSVPA